eukprot:Ihof_evm1s821 gene=Ihof_evmTU1s821
MVATRSQLDDKPSDKNINDDVIDAVTMDTTDLIQPAVAQEKTSMEGVSNQKPSTSYVFESPIPEICKNEPCAMGIDEAGRGPVLGPMVYGTSFCPVSKMDDLKKLGFADSKKLTEPQRDHLFQVIKDNNDYIGYNVHVLSPQEISGSMLRRKKYNLNAMSYDSAIGLVRKALSHGVKITQLYVDTIGDAKKYQHMLSGLFPGITVVVESKADDTYPIVSAASICAKVTRDTEIKQWRFEEQELTDISRVFGSGYPGDPNTKAWLHQNLDPVFGFPSLVRFSWGTAKKIMEDKCVPAD